MELKFKHFVLIIIAILAGISTFGWYLILNEHTDQPTIYYKEVTNLRCAGVNAIGCTTVLSSNTFLIEYVPNSQRCFKEGCISLNYTISHELNHVDQYLRYGRMWEVE